MAILQELKKLTQDEVVQGVVETIIDTDDLFKILPFRKVTGAALQVTWEDTIPSANFIAPDGTIPQSTGTTLTQFSDGIKVIARDIDIPNYATAVMGADAQVMLYGEVKAIARAYKQNVIVGDETTNPNVFNGMDKQIERAETAGIQRSVDAAAGTLTFKLMDELLKLMKMGADVIFMHSQAYIAYKELLRQAGGTDSAMLQLPNFGRPMLTFEGIPIIRNDNIPLTTDASGNVLTNIYAGVISESEGITGLYAGDNAGISYQVLGQAQDKDATRYRFKWYCGFTVLNPYAVGVIKNIKVA